MNPDLPRDKRSTIAETSSKNISEECLHRFVETTQTAQTIKDFNFMKSILKCI